MSRFYGVLVELRWRSLSGLGCDVMQNFNATNVVLNSMRLATPCKSGVWGWWQFAQNGKVLRSFAQKNAKMSRFYCVLVALRWRSLNGLGCEEIQNFNTTNVVLNSI